MIEEFIENESHYVHSKEFHTKLLFVAHTKNRAVQAVNLSLTVRYNFVFHEPNSRPLSREKKGKNI